MAEALRTQRLLADLQTLQALQASSTIFDFQQMGDPPQCYRLTFRGRGVRQKAPAVAAVAVIECHQCELRLPASYPESPPDVRWLTPLFHPNVSWGGLLELDQIQWAWDSDSRLEGLCERLWDVARLAYVNLQRTSNAAAAKWLKQQPPPMALPLDPRPLRDKSVPDEANVIGYQWHGHSQVKLWDAAAGQWVLLQEHSDPGPDPQPQPAGQRGPQDEGVLYIDDP